MDKKEEKDKFQVVKQVEIDGELYHESAEVAFSISSETKHENGKDVKYYTLNKYIIVRGKLAKSQSIRTEKGINGREIIKIQLDLEMKKDLRKRDL
jgi:hypothetical protein